MVAPVVWLAMTDAQWGRSSATCSACGRPGLRLMRLGYSPVAAWTFSERCWRGVAHSDSIAGAATSVNAVAVCGEFMSGFSGLGKDTAAVTAPSAATTAIPRKAEW
jgi:hypothetical protein